MPFRNEGYFFGVLQGLNIFNPYKRLGNFYCRLAPVSKPVSKRVFSHGLSEVKRLKREEGLNIFNPYKRLEAFFNGALCFCKKLCFKSFYFVPSSLCAFVFQKNFVPLCLCAFVSKKSRLRALVFQILRIKKFQQKFINQLAIK